VGRSAAFYQVAVGHLVGPVDSEVDTDLVQLRERNAHLTGQCPRLEGSRNADDVEARIDLSADGSDGVGRRAPRPEPDDHPVLDQFGRRFAGRSFHRVGATLFHTRP